MGQFFAYSLQSAICLALFYLFFKALLSRDTFHHFNRVALLGVLVLSLIAPIIAIPLTSVITKGTDSVMVSDINAEIIPDMADMGVTNESSPEAGNIYLSWLLMIYLTGCVLCLIYSTVSIIRIIRIIQKGKRVSTDKGTCIITSNNDIHPFSWMKYIVMSQDDYSEAGDTIIIHEKAHISLRHTHDLIIAQLCIITQWFNPAIWLLYQELQNIHEYEADEKVLSQGVNARQYQLLLIKKAVGTRLYSMANSFNHSNLKKRITMMLQKKSNSWARLKYAYVLPLAAIILAACSNEEISKKIKEISDAKISHLVSETNTNADDYVFITVEKMPEFPGGDAALLKWISENVNYPTIAAENGVQGRVNCTFVVNADGSVTDVSVVRGIDPNLDKEATRVLSKLPKFRPGEQRGKPVRVKYSVPVRFQLKQ